MRRTANGAKHLRLTTCLGLFLLAVLALGVSVPDLVYAQGDFMIYPKKGQSQRQQDKDTYECSDWAQHKTGFDPSYQASQPPPPPPGPSGSDVARGAIGGAALGAAAGAIGGAIAGRPGKGAAIGAGTGAVIGGASQLGAGSPPPPREDPYYEQKRNDYNRAFTACMEGRNYTVR